MYVYWIKSFVENLFYQKNEDDRPRCGARKQNQNNTPKPLRGIEVFVFSLCLQFFCEAAFMTSPSKFKTCKFIGLAHLISEIFATTAEKQWVFQH